MTAEFMRMLAALQEQTKASFWRSDVLRPLHILFLAVASVTVGFTFAKAPEPLIYGSAALLGIVTLTEIGGFVYCLLRDPDLLRSERIRMHKMAIEARLIGDEASGMFEIEEAPQNHKLSPPPKVISSRSIDLEPTASVKPARARTRKSTGNQL